MELSRLPSTGKAEWSEFRLTRECAQQAASPPVGKAFRLCRQLASGQKAARAFGKNLAKTAGMAYTGWDSITVEKGEGLP